MPNDRRQTPFVQYFETQLRLGWANFPIYLKMPFIFPHLSNDRTWLASGCWFFITKLLRFVIFVDSSAVSTPARIILGPVLVAHLTTALSTSVLPALGETLVQIRPNDTLIELSAANVLHAIQRILVCVVFDEAEPAWRLLKSVKTHH